jgi:hypothetical protein
MARTALLLAAAATCVAPLRADEKYAIKVKGTGRGQTLRVERDDTFVTRLRILDGTGQVTLDRTERGGEVFVFRETVLEPGDDFPVRCRRHYEKAQVKKGRRPAELAFHGRTVIIEKKGGRYRFRLEGGGELAGKDAEPLDREFNGGDDKFRLPHLLPDKPVPVGGAWKVGMDPLVKDFRKSGRFGAVAAKATGEGRLIMASPMGGAQFGQLSFRLEIPVETVAMTGGRPQPLRPESKATFDLSLHLCIDGTELTGTFQSSGELYATGEVPLPGGGGNGKMILSVQSDGRQSLTEAAERTVP